MWKAIGISVLAIVGVLFISALGRINNVPTLEENVKSKWGQVENVYQRRADLIPNLVEVVGGYAKHEKETLTSVIEARAKATQAVLPASVATDPKAQAAFLQAQDGLGAALARLMVVIERYPNLKADSHFAQLQSQLEGTENRIAVERRNYVTAVQALNTEIRTFPGNIVNALFWQVKPIEQFKADAGASKAPKVSFK